MAEKEVKDGNAAPRTKSKKAAATVRTLVYCPERRFMAPYMNRAFGEENVVVTDKLPSSLPDGVRCAVMISATKIYDVVSGEGVTEDAPIEKKSFWTNYEGHFASFLRANGLPGCVLRCSYVIGTGMTGFPMWLARGINAGWLFHVAGNDSRVSLVHATDVAALSRLFADRLMAAGDAQTVIGPLNVTDGEATPVDDLIDALAFRINDKKVWTVSGLVARMATLFYDRTRYEEMTTTLTFDDARLIAEAGDYRMHRVTEYLRTHDYGADSI